MRDLHLELTPGFIPRHAPGTKPTFEQAAALFAHGDVNGVLRDLYAKHHTPAGAPVLEKAAANGH